MQKLQRFESLSVREQRRIRDLHRQIGRDAESAALDRVATRYYQWLKQQTPGQRAELRQLAPDARIEKIRQLQVAEQEKKRRTLSEADQKVVVAWLREWIIRGGRGHMLSDRSRHPRAGSDRGAAHDRPGRHPPGSMPIDRVKRIERMEMMARLLIRARPERIMHLIETGDMRRLAERLSPAAREKLEQMPSVTERKGLVVEWIRQAARAAADRPVASSNRWTQEQLETFFAEQIRDNDLREELLGLPREEMLHALRRMATRHDAARRGNPSPRPRP